MAAIRQLFCSTGQLIEAKCTCEGDVLIGMFSYSRRQSPGGGGDQERQFRAELEAYQAAAQTARERRDSVCGGLPWLPAEVCSDARPKIQEG